MTMSRLERAMVNASLRNPSVAAAPQTFTGYSPPAASPDPMMNQHAASPKAASRSFLTSHLPG
jgi:hypothetical protein